MLKIEQVENWGPALVLISAFWGGWVQSLEEPDAISASQFLAVNSILQKILFPFQATINPLVSGSPVQFYIFAYIQASVLIDFC